MHIWGAPAWDELESRRAIYAGAADGTGLTILSSRPAGSDHDDELRSGYLVRNGDQPTTEQFGEVLLSTVYDAQQMPRSAGAELYFAEEQFGRRLSGESLCETSIDSGGRAHRISFFRWSLDGARLWGSYQSVSAL